MFCWRAGTLQFTNDVDVCPQREEEAERDKKGTSEALGHLRVDFHALELGNFWIGQGNLNLICISASPTLSMMRDR
jgi:hypothetical protein